MKDTLMRTVPYIAARYQGRKQTPKTISLRLSDTTPISGAALGIANYWHSPSSPHESCHYVVDEEFIYQCVPDNLVAPTSLKGTVRINVCAMPVFDVEFWMDHEYLSVLENTSRIAAMLCWKYGIPVRDIDSLEHQKFFGRGGIMCNVNGAWPKKDFLSLVQDRLDLYKEEGGL